MRTAAVAVLGLFLAPAPAGAESWTSVDDRPRQIAPGAWHFSINVPVRPVGQLQFVNAEYDFYDFATGVGAPTEGIAVDYAANGPGVDWTDDRTCLGIAPTLFDEEDGFIHGWSAWDLPQGKFEGTVYATAPLLRVSFTAFADGLAHGRGRR